MATTPPPINPTQVEEKAADARPPIAIVVDDEPANRDFLERLIQQADRKSVV